MSKQLNLQQLSSIPKPFGQVYVRLACYKISGWVIKCYKNPQAHVMAESKMAKEILPWPPVVIHRSDLMRFVAV